MNPDVASAVDALVAAGTLTAEQARPLARAARRELVSVHGELRLLAYAGVVLVMGGVSLLVKENLQRIGPLAIAAVLALAAAACFAWVQLRSPAFTWGEVKSPHLALDYMLLLGALLAAADLAYAEAQFTPLGDAWPRHLLVVAVFYALLALRYDSRVLLSLALSTFAAWRGVSAGRLEHVLWLGSDDLVRANAAACGLLFLAAGGVLRAGGRKAHFEPVLTHLGWLLLLGSAASSLGGDRGALWALLLIVLALLLAAIGYLQRRRFSLIALAIAAAYVGVSALFVRVAHEDLLVFAWFSLTPLAVVGVLFAAHRFLKEPA
jgi:hypothetical protein